MKYNHNVSRSGTYQHYCATARALDRVGDRWTLLIVRDLLSGPKRFTELQGLLSRVTPRQLTLRLKEMQVAGLVHRAEEPGRKRVTYSLSKLGRSLRPVVYALTNWGAKNAMGPPLSTELVHPEHLLHGAAVVLASAGLEPPSPVRWRFRLDDHAPLTLQWSGIQGAGRWKVLGDLGQADLDICTTARVLASLVFEPDRGPELMEQVRFEGDAGQVQLFHRAIGALCRVARG